MGYSNTKAGPDIATTDPDIAAENANAGNGNRRLGLMPGFVVKVNQNISVSPRMNWIVNQPMNTATVGVNANIHTI
jgi:hypothetical protein